MKRFMVGVGLISILIAFILLVAGVREEIVVVPLLALGLIGLTFSKYGAYGAGASE